MARKDKRRLQLAGKIREMRNKQKKKAYTRPEDSEKSYSSKGGLRSVDDDKKLVKEANEARKRMRDARRKKAKKGFFSKLFGSKK